MQIKWQDYILNIKDYPKPGVNFKDITPLLKNNAAFKAVIDEFVDYYCKMNLQAEVIVCPEARGFIFAAAVAYQLNLGLIPVRKPGKLPRPTQSIDYALEYNETTLELHKEDLDDLSKVIIMDDILATGGTVAACISLLQSKHIKIEACLFLAELSSLEGHKKLQNVNKHSLICY